MPSPFSLSELPSRTRSLLRVASGQRPKCKYLFDKLWIHWSVNASSYKYHRGLEQ